MNAVTTLVTRIEDRGGEFFVTVELSSRQTSVA